MIADATTICDVRVTGKERDAETGLDYFGARYMSSAQGRFTSPDPKLMPSAFDDPQSWNKYGYVRNNPLRLVDPDGEDWLDIFNGTANAVKSNAVAGLGRETGNSDFRLGQRIGDAISVVGGGIEMIGSAVSIGGGGAACATGAGCLAGASAIVEGLAVGAHGVSTAGTGINNLINGNAQVDQSGTNGSGKLESPEIHPGEVSGKSPSEIHATAKEKGLVPKGPDPMSGKGAYVDPVTGQQRILSHPNTDAPHAHVNNPAGERLGPGGRVVHPESPEAHLPIKKDPQ